MSGIQTVLEPEWVPAPRDPAYLLDILKKSRLHTSFQRFSQALIFLDFANQGVGNWQNIIHLDVRPPSLEGTLLSKQSSRKNEGVRKFNTPLQ